MREVLGGILLGLATVASAYAAGTLIAWLQAVL